MKVNVFLSNFIYYVGGPCASLVALSALLFSWAIPVRSGRLTVFMPATGGVNSIRWQGIETDTKLPVALLGGSVAVVPPHLEGVARENQGRACTFATKKGEFDYLPTLRLLQCSQNVAESLPTTGA